MHIKPPNELLIGKKHLQRSNSLANIAALRTRWLRPRVQSSKLTLSLVARIAQSVEQRIENPRVPGSIPGSGTTFKVINSKVIV